MSKQNKYNDLMQSIKDDEVKTEKQNELSATLGQIKVGLDALKEEKQSINEAMANGVIVLKGLGAATASADNITSGICNAIVKAQNTTIKVSINDEGLQQLDERNTIVINCLTELLDNHRAKVAVLLERQRQEIADITRRSEGIHFSKRVFFWLAGIWFISVGIIIIELTLGVLYLFGYIN